MNVGRCMWWMLVVLYLYIPSCPGPQSELNERTSCSWMYSHLTHPPLVLPHTHILSIDKACIIIQHWQCLAFLEFVIDQVLYSPVWLARSLYTRANWSWANTYVAESITTDCRTCYQLLAPIGHYQLCAKFFVHSWQNAADKAYGAETSCNQLLFILLHIHTCSRSVCPILTT